MAEATRRKLKDGLPQIAETKSKEAVKAEMQRDAIVQE
jgi:hypothetical protein